ncbi:MAG: hypothetical protein L6V93_12805 [Clostridiales bacterium]|nr:MAG: hypothetical protein L6V93_12805 [Clostridiales bacterium]
MYVSAERKKPLYSLKGERVITLNCNGGSLYGGIYKTDITEAVTEQNKNQTSAAV